MLGVMQFVNPLVILAVDITLYMLDLDSHQWEARKPTAGKGASAGGPCRMSEVFNCLHAVQFYRFSSTYTLYIT